MPSRPVKHRRASLRAAALPLVALAAGTALIVPSPGAAQVDPATIITAGWTVYTTVKSCIGNVNQNLPCLQTDGQNIRQVMKDVQSLRDEVRANNALATAQLSLVQGTLDQGFKDQLAQLLNPVTLNTRDAARSMTLLLACGEARANGAATCQGAAKADGTREIVAVQKGITYHKANLRRRVGLMSDDIKTTAALFTGTADQGPDSGLIGRVWKAAKNRQDQAAGVARTDSVVPVVTEELSSEVRAFNTAYADYLKLYGLLKPFVRGMDSARARAAGDTATADTLEAEARSMDNDVRSALRAPASENPYSMAARLATYKVPALRRGQVAFLRQSTSPPKAYIISVDDTAASGLPAGEYGGGDAYDAGDSLLRRRDIFRLGSTLVAYGTPSKLMTAMPASFPPKVNLFSKVRNWLDDDSRNAKWFPTDRWYRVRAGANPLTASPSKNASGPPWCADPISIPGMQAVGTKLASGGVVLDEAVAMRITDATPTMPSDAATSLSGLARPCNMDGIDFTAQWTANVVGPADFLWRHMFRAENAGPGAYVHTFRMADVGWVRPLSPVPPMMGWPAGVS